MRNSFVAKAIFFFAVLFTAFSAAMAGQGIAVTNRIGGEIKTVYGMAPGHNPWNIAADLADGETETVSPERLRACARVVVDLGDNTILQFFTVAYLDGAESIGIEPRPVGKADGEATPWLVFTEGGQARRVNAGLPFHILRGDFENGMTESKYAEWLNPLALSDDIPDLYAIAIAGTSWHILEPGAVFDGGSKGKGALRALTLTAPFAGKNLESLIDELAGTDAEPVLLEFRQDAIFAFNEQGLAMEKSAVLMPGMDKVSAKERWETLAARLGAITPEDFDEDEPALRLVFASPGVVYELLMDLAESVALFSMVRR